MLILKFDKNSIRDDIDHELTNKFPGIVYKKKEIKNKRFGIIEIHLDVKEFTSELLRSFEYDFSYIGFEVKVNE